MKLRVPTCSLIEAVLFSDDELIDLNAAKSSFKKDGEIIRLILAGQEKATCVAIAGLIRNAVRTTAEVKAQAVDRKSVV